MHLSLHHWKRQEDFKSFFWQFIHRTGDWPVVKVWEWITFFQEKLYKRYERGTCTSSVKMVYKRIKGLDLEDWGSLPVIKLCRVLLPRFLPNGEPCPALYGRDVLRILGELWDNSRKLCKPSNVSQVCIQIDILKSPNSTHVQITLG